MDILINKISTPIKLEMKSFDKFFKDNLRSDVKLINTVINYLCKIKGKQFRTTLCLLCSNLSGKKTNNFSYLSAATVEMLHIATLLHDDVVDDSDVRRGWPTINAIWKNKISILVGDYMFSKALINISQFNNLECINVLASISKRLSEGEIIQIEKAINKSMNEDTYFKMISDKTASLISASCFLGFYSNNNDEGLGESIKKFGEYLGIAYQIKDDIFDIIGNIKDTGKSSDLDLKKNMLTLPYIYSISQLDKKSRRSLLIKIRKIKSKEDIIEIKNTIERFGGIEYSKKKLFEYSDKARYELSKFPNSKYKEALEIAIDFNINRKY